MFVGIADGDDVVQLVIDRDVETFEEELALLIRKLCKPKGMLIIVIISTSPAMKYSKAMCSPPKIIQMIFPNVFILISF